MTDLRTATQLTQDRLKCSYFYDPETGMMLRRFATNRHPAWSEAGTITTQGYVHICIDNKFYKGHRLAWLYMTGVMPDSYIDHANRVKSDNRWANLRLASPSENQWNHDLKATNTSGISGVHFCNTSKKWKAACKINGTRHYLGTFSEKFTAGEAIVNFRRANHHQFARAEAVMAAARKHKGLS